MRVVIGVMAWALGLGLAQPSARAQEAAKAFACTFKAGTTLTYDQGKFRRAPAKPIVFDVADIDLAGQKAQLVTAKGRGEVRVVRALNANHFLEVVAEGFLNITTIYDRDKAGAHPAVHSRHFGLFGEPVVAQYQGFCLPQ